MLELQITQTRHHLRISDRKISKSMRKYSRNVHKIEGAHLQYVNNHYAQFEYKRNENFCSYRLHKLGIPKVLQMAGQIVRWSRLLTIPAFAKGTQIRNI